MSTELSRQNFIFGIGAIAISMAEIGCPEQNGYAERLMRTIKKEEVDLSGYEDFSDARQHIGHFLDEVYMRKRIHSSLGYLLGVHFKGEIMNIQNLISLIILMLVLPFPPEAQTEIDLVRQHAPILHFHPGEGSHCCYPSNAEEDYGLITNNQFTETREPKVFQPNAPCYYQYWSDVENNRQITRIKYWFWYKFNDFPEGPDPFGSHEGDWESVEVVLVNEIPCLYILSKHDSPTPVVPGEARLCNGKIEVWVGNGSHANYPAPDSTPDSYYTCRDTIEDNGSRWEINNLKAIAGTNFASFTGQWGNHTYTIDILLKKWRFEPPVSPVVRQFQNSIPSLNANLPLCESLNLRNVSISGNKPPIKAKNSITVGPNFIIQAGANVTFGAGSRIILKPGFKVENGARFRAYIDQSLR